jgi:hypothetical protein
MTASGMPAAFFALRHQVDARREFGSPPVPRPKASSQRCPKALAGVRIRRHLRADHPQGFVDQPLPLRLDRFVVVHRKASPVRPA